MRPTILLFVSQSVFLIPLHAAVPSPLAQMHFEPTASGFVAKANGYWSQIDSSGSTFAAEGAAAWRMRFPGARKTSGKGIDPTGAVSNYFLGKDPSHWRTNVPHYNGVRFAGIWPGIDVVYHSEKGNVEYDFVVNPGADSSRIEVAFDSSTPWTESPGGELRIETTAGIFVMHKPRVYQEVGDNRVEVTARYKIRGAKLRFDLAAFDPRRPLVIDPVISYFAYLGGAAADSGRKAQSTSDGGVVICGDTSSANFPVTATALDRTFSPNSDSFESADVFLSRFDRAGRLVYSTYVGGGLYESCNGLRVDAADNLYLAIRTNSTDYPTTAGSYGQQKSTYFSSAVTKINAAGNSLVFSTYFHDLVEAFTIDSAGNPYLIVNNHSRLSSNLVATPGSARPVRLGDAHLSKLNATGSAIVYTTGIGPGAYLFGLVQIGGGRAVTVDPSGNA